MTERRRWRDLSPARRRIIGVLSVVEAVLAAGAWWDLAHRRAEDVNGSKPAWAAAVAVNFVGPLAYFRWGRRAQRSGAPPVPGAFGASDG